MSKLRLDLDTAIIRDDVWASLKPVDGLGRPMMKRMGAVPFVEVAIKAGIPTRTVPAEYWRTATDLENHPQAVIDCQCGGLVIAELHELRPCHKCQRCFFFTGLDVFVLNTPAP